MASNRPGEMQHDAVVAQRRSHRFQWPQIGRVRCNPTAETYVKGFVRVSMASNRPGEMQLLHNKGRCREVGFNGLKSAG